MSERQKQFEGISDPGNYRKLCEPLTMEQAEKAVAAFYEDIYAIRNKHRIADAYVILKIVVATEDGEGEILTSMHCGNELMRECMTAWAFGHEQGLRQEKISELLREKPAVRRKRTDPKT